MSCVETRVRFGRRPEEWPEWLGNRKETVSLFFRESSVPPREQESCADEAPQCGQRVKDRGDSLPIGEPDDDVQRTDPDQHEKSRLEEEARHRCPRRREREQWGEEIGRWPLRQGAEEEVRQKVGIRPADAGERAPDEVRPRLVRAQPRDDRVEGLQSASFPGGATQPRVEPLLTDGARRPIDPVEDVVEIEVRRGPLVEVALFARTATHVLKDPDLVQGAARSKRFRISSGDFPVG